MAADARTVVLRQHEDVWSRGKLDAVSEIFAETFVGHHPGLPDWLGPEGVTEAALREPHSRTSPNPSEM